MSTSAYGALLRAERLLVDLDTAARPGDVAQAVHGALHEIRAVQHLVRHETALATANGPGKVRADAPQTSRDAARSVVIRSGNQRGRILLALLQATTSGLTDYELQNMLSIGPSSERPRRGELVEMGLVFALTRTKAHNGSDWTAWALTTQGSLVANRLTASDGVLRFPDAARGDPDGQLMIL